MGTKKRVLFICETVTLAHIMRSASLASALRKDKYEVHFCAGEVPEFIADQLRNIQIHPLPTAVSSRIFLAALDAGKIPYTEKIITSQVAEDLELIEKIQPDLIVGDFRLSLLISARIAKVPFINVTNLTWHPSAKLTVQVPEIPIVDLLGVHFAKFIFRLLKPFIFASMAKPFNNVARRFGMSSLGTLDQIYTSGDYVFYADLPGIVETADLPKSHHVAGPVTGQLQSELSPDIQSWLGDRPLVLVSLGSSGPQRILPQILNALNDLPVQVLVSTAGQQIEITSQLNTRVVDFLPIEKLLAKASVLICNGGSPSCYAAAEKGVPVLAIPSNLDQFNCSQAFVDKGMALRLRQKEVQAQAVKESVLRLLHEENLRTNAKNMQRLIANHNAHDYFCNLVLKIVKPDLIVRYDISESEVA